MSASSRPVRSSHETLILVNKQEKKLVGCVGLESQYSGGDGRKNFVSLRPA